MSQPLRTSIAKDGQRYVDEPIVVAPKPVSGVTRALADVYGRQLPSTITTGHERVRLRWMTSDGKGGLKPREKQ